VHSCEPLVPENSAALRAKSIQNPIGHLATISHAP
jgi:hypothetical protein